MIEYYRQHILRLPHNGEEERVRPNDAAQVFHELVFGLDANALPRLARVLAYNIDVRLRVAYQPPGPHDIVRRRAVFGNAAILALGIALGVQNPERVKDVYWDLDRPKAADGLQEHDVPDGGRVHALCEHLH